MEYLYSLMGNSYSKSTSLCEYSGKLLYWLKYSTKYNNSKLNIYLKYFSKQPGGYNRVWLSSLIGLRHEDIFNGETENF